MMICLRGIITFYSAIPTETARSSMRTLIAYYSRTGTTRIVAEQLARIMAADIEEVIDTKGRRGIFGFLMSGYQAMTEKAAVIKPPQKDPSQYDLVVIATPIWAGKMSCAALAYLRAMPPSGKAPGAVAFVATSGGDDDAAKAFAQMGAACGRTPVATARYIERYVKSGSSALGLEQFAARAAKPQA